MTCETQRIVKYCEVGYLFACRDYGEVDECNDEGCCLKTIKRISKYICEVKNILPYISAGTMQNRKQMECKFTEGGIMKTCIR